MSILGEDVIFVLQNNVLLEVSELKSGANEIRVQTNVTCKILLLDSCRGLYSSFLFRLRDEPINALLRRHDKSIKLWKRYGWK